MYKDQINNLNEINVNANLQTLNAIFLCDQNKKMLLEIITEEITKKKGNIDKTNLILLFDYLFEKFYQDDKYNNSSLITMNKNFITILLNEVGKIKNNNVEDYLKSEAVTIQDQQKERKQQFDNQYSKKQKEFEESINKKTPPLPDFNLKKDEPIIEMEEIIKKTIAQRNFEINKVYESNNTVAPPVKNTNVAVAPVNRNNNENNFKYIKIDNNEINSKINAIDLDKHISWKDTKNENNVLQKNNNLESNNIFSKLKKTNVNAIVPSNNNVSASTNENNKLNMNLIASLVTKIDKNINLNNDVNALKQNVDSLSVHFNNLNGITLGIFFSSTGLIIVGL
jgi:hypothetical protein